MRRIDIKVGQKGGVSVYGLQRFPVTLYAEQWELLLAHAGNILQFVADNSGQLARKEESKDY